MFRDTRKRKAPGGNEKTTVEGIAWLDKKTIPKGTSPLSDFGDAYQSDGDDVYQGFLSTDSIIVSVRKSIKAENLNAIIQPFLKDIQEQKVEVVNKLKDVHLKFKSSKLAIKAFKKLGEMKKEDFPIVGFSWSMDPKYHTYCITKFAHRLSAKEVANEVRKYFSPYGEILEIHIPDERPYMVYLYLSLGEGVSPNSVLKSKMHSLTVRECNMKAKKSRIILPRLEEERQKILQRYT